MDEARQKAISDGANMRTGGINFNYVDTTKLERLGIKKYSTKKPKGNNFIRIVAPSTSGPFAKEIHQHTQIGSNNATYLCLNEMFGEPCPICDHIQDLRRQNESNDVIKELQASKRFLLFVVDVTSRESEEEGTQWFDCPPSIYKQVCLLSHDRRTGEKIDPTDPVDGRDIEFIREDGKITKYTGFVLVKTDAIPESWYDDLPSFDEILLKPDSDEMLTAVSGVKKNTADSEEKIGRESVRESRREPDRESRREPDGESRRERESVRESRREDSSESRRESAEDEQDSEQAAAIKNKINDIQNRRRSRE